MPVHLTPLPAGRFDEWQRAARQRLIDGNRASGRRLGHDAAAYADEFFDGVLPQGAKTPTARVMRIVDERRRELGTLWLVLAGRKLFLLDLAVASELTELQNDELVARIVTIARDMGATQISAPLFPQDAAGHALVEGRGFGVASIQMVLEPLPARDVSSQVVVAPMTAERFPRFLTDSEEGFAQDLVASGRFTPEEAAAESRRQLREELPDGLDTEGQTFYTAAVDGVEVGILWLGMRERDGRPHAFVLDIEVAADQRRKGYGRELMHAAEREARRLGADSIGLHVFGFNSAAVELYEGLGYRRTEESLLRDL
ncbi:MAG: family N-acetyltransferase [Microbacterium sp.]|jgi:ribosomal protein S18 acetylase RimI-like enzyme|uniref:GNAT family N-acetyltransferase n=1 Tax=Microbacterium sp. TaxID=51671 RepID=UPI00263455E6|nr:GNAT family N-acetyltransferase [Microbacterium sp.]MDF2559139.1 family N-acetyltransferase [Microbacterium sp.]